MSKTSRSALVVGVLAVATTTTALLSWWVVWRIPGHCRRRDEDEDSLQPGLPSHVERHLYKEERRKRLIHYLTMKNPMYDNILMQDPDGNPLSTISLKKAKWYVNKSLGNWIVPPEDNNNNNNIQSVIRLRFQPNNRIADTTLAVYHVSAKANQCVVCGANASSDGSNHGMRHYVVPFCYRTLFPDAYKTHLSHDVVLMCIDCHVYAEQCSQRRRKKLEKAVVRTNPKSTLPNFIDRHKQTVTKQALALLKRRQQMPAMRIQECQAAIRNFHGLKDEAPLSTALLQETANMSYTTPNPHYISGPTLVVEPLLQAYYEQNGNDELLAMFVRDWRAYFLQTSQPSCLPQGWSINSPVHCEKRGSYNHRDN